MKIRLSHLVAVAALAASSAFAAGKSEKKPSSVTVTFQEPDKFTDAKSTFGMGADEGYLDIISEHLQKVAGKQLAQGQKLDITISDIDLAGDIRPEMTPHDIRVVKSIYIPRMTLSFKLTDASGALVKEGQRKLSDLDFMDSIGLIGRDQPLYYDKEMLTDWVRREFKS